MSPPRQDIGIDDVLEGKHLESKKSKGPAPKHKGILYYLISTAFDHE